MLKLLLSLFWGIVIVSAQTAWAAETDAQRLLSMRERADEIDRLTALRLDTVLKPIMRRTGIDMWVIIAREYNEDPVMKSILPADWMSARRRTMLVIFDDGSDKPLQRLAVARYNVGNLFNKAWDPQKQPDQYAALADLIKALNPHKIGIDRSDSFGIADGLSSTEYDALNRALGSDLQQRLVSAEYLAIGWLETRIDEEMDHYQTLVKLGHALIARAFSNEVITPGETTTKEVEWWLVEQSRRYHLSHWFHPSVSVQRASQIASTNGHPDDQDQVIMPGDLLHVDFGMTYLRLHSDQQQHAYVLKPGETSPPQALIDALRTGNQLQDIFTHNFKVGRSGNDVLKLSRQQAMAQGITPTIYSHPIGFHGHAAGTTLGMWDAQQGVPVQGDYPLHDNTAYAIELNAAVTIEGWDSPVRIMLEEQAWLHNGQVTYLDDRQTTLHLIRSDYE